jgi:hypothetical protein
MAVLNKMGEAYARRDKEAFLDLLVPDSDVFLYGTGADEKRRGTGRNLGTGGGAARCISTASQA